MFKIREGSTVFHVPILLPIRLWSSLSCQPVMLPSRQNEKAPREHFKNVCFGLKCSLDFYSSSEDSTAQPGLRISTPSNLTFSPGPWRCPR